MKLIQNLNLISINDQDQNIGGTMEIVRLEQLFENNKNDTSQTATDDNGSNVANNNHQQQQQQKNKITVNPLSLEKQNETTEIESGRKKDAAKLSDDHSLL